MPDTCNKQLKGLSGTLTAKFSESSATELFIVQLTSSDQDLISVCNRARAANPTQFPLIGQAWPVRPTYGWFAKQFNPVAQDSRQTLWHITVTYLPLQPGEQNTEGTNDNPLFWPAVRNMEWIEYEQLIEEARNVEEFGHKSAAGNRAVGTLGRIENSARQEPDEGLFETYRDPVVCITRNYATIDQIYAIASQYARTCNSDTIAGIGPRRWKFLGIDTPGETVANGIKYYPGTIRAQLMNTTDRTMNNVGWSYWREIILENFETTKKLVKLKVKEVDDDGDIVKENDKDKLIDPSEPLFLNMSGGADGTGAAKKSFSDTPTKITWRYLTEVPYAPILLG